MPLVGVSICGVYYVGGDSTPSDITTQASQALSQFSGEVGMPDANFLQCLTSLSYLQTQKAADVMTFETSLALQSVRELKEFAACPQARAVMEP